MTCFLARIGSVECLVWKDKTINDVVWSVDVAKLLKKAGNKPVGIDETALKHPTDSKNWSR